MSDEEVRHFAAILERVEDTMRVLAEGHSSLRDDFNAMSANFGTLNKTVDRIDDNVTVLNERMTRVEHHLGLNGTSKPAKRPSKKR